MTSNMSFSLCNTIHCVHAISLKVCSDLGLLLKVSVLSECLFLLQIQSNGDFIIETEKSSQLTLPSTVSLCVLILVHGGLPPSSYSYEPLDASALAVHTLSITLTIGSTNNDNTNIQKRAQSLMGDWLFSH